MLYLAKTVKTKCTGGQNYTTCGSACTKTCQNPNPVCMRGCVKKCQCPTGTVLQKGNCIDKADCPVKVEANDSEKCFFQSHLNRLRFINI